MPKIPKDQGFDNTLSLLADPYRFIRDRCHKHGSDIFQTRIMLQKTICMTGPDSAKLFYDSTRFQRTGSAPEPVRATLFGKGGLQGLDGEAHKNRKKLFLSIMSDESITELTNLVEHWLSIYAKTWTRRSEVILYDEFQEILTRAVCQWVGVPLPEEDLKKRTMDLTAMFDAAAAKGPRHLYSRFARKSAEAWIAGLVSQMRVGKLKVPSEKALDIFARHLDSNGQLLAPKIVAIEILNLLRPTVAVSVYMLLIAHALETNPECAKAIRHRKEKFDEYFVQEVRRYYPFFPAVVAKTRTEFQWNGFHFPKGVRVILDLYGINHDHRTWDKPEAFRPERFSEWNKSPFNFIPQGGGDHAAHHRCPGEWITIEIMKLTALFFATRLKYEVPEQDLTLDYSRAPAIPKSRFRISNVRELDQANNRSHSLQATRAPYLLQTRS